MHGLLLLLSTLPRGLLVNQGGVAVLGTTPMPRTMAILWPIFMTPTLIMLGAGISRG